MQHSSHEKLCGESLIPRSKRFRNLLRIPAKGVLAKFTMDGKQNAPARQGGAKKIRRADGTPARRTIFHISSRTPILRTDAKWDIDRPFIRRTEAAEGWHTQTGNPWIRHVAHVVHNLKHSNICANKDRRFDFGLFSCPK